METEDNHDFILEIFKKSYELCLPVVNNKGVNPSLGKVFEFLLETAVSFDSDLDKSNFELNWSKFKNYIFDNFIYLEQSNNFKDEWSRVIFQIEKILNNNNFENDLKGKGFRLFFEKDFSLLFKEANEEKNEWIRSSITKNTNV